VTEEQPSEPLVSDESGETIATPDASVGSDAPEPSPTIEESTALEPPDATESAATDEAVAVAQIPEDDVESIPPAQALAEPTAEDESSAVVGAPSVLVTAEQIDAATPDEAPEDATEDATEDAVENVTGYSTADVAEEGPSETEVGAPTLLIAAAQFGEAAPAANLGEATGKGPAETAIGAPTLLVTAIDFGDEAEDANAEPDPETEVSAEGQPEAAEPAEVETAAPESAAGGSTESETAEIEITATDDGTTNAADAAEAAPADEAEPEATQTAALVATGTEDYATATAAFEIGDCPTALRYYEQAFEKGGLPRQALASGYNNRGRCLYDNAQYDEALADFDRAIGLDREFAAAYYNRGRAHNAMGNSAEARADLKSAYDFGFGRLQPLQ
jgi:tetratricopeptide (TPR) repeat protein